VSYSDIIRFKNLGKLANRRKGRNVLVNPFKNGIVKDGLALWLDG